jgi:lipoic acid synthetase
VANASKVLGLKYVVVTSVTRDDLPDGGAEHFAKTISALKKEIPDCHVEVIIPDLGGSKDALAIVVNAKPDVLNHNLETVSRLYDIARPEADYTRSLELLRSVKDIDPNMPTKSGIMLGLGETEQELTQALRDLREAKCSMLTLGQYLQPTKKSLPVDRFVTPEEFENWKQEALKMGFSQVASGPLVRSSYHAKELFGS